MNFLRKLFGRTRSTRSGRFNRYYGNVLRTGVGYPTAHPEVTLAALLSRMTLLIVTEWFVRWHDGRNTQTCLGSGHMRGVIPYVL